MFEKILNYRLDVLAFSAVLMIAMLGVHIWLHRRERAGRVPLQAWLLLTGIMVAGAIAAEIAGEHERHRLRDMLQGIAPTYAQEMTRMGHADLPFNCAADDPRYLAIIDAEIRWEK